MKLTYLVGSSESGGSRVSWNPHPSLPAVPGSVSGESGAQLVWARSTFDSLVFVSEVMWGNLRGRFRMVCKADCEVPNKGFADRELGSNPRSPIAHRVTG